jgi:hypothetical protein
VRHARIVGAAGVLFAICSLGATLYLWLRSGAVVRVKAFIRPESGSVHIEATNSGRLTATIKRLELREHIVLKVMGGGGGTTTFSQWAMPVKMNEANSTVELSPTAYIEIDYPVQEVLAKAAGAPTVTVAAWAQRAMGSGIRRHPSSSDNGERGIHFSTVEISGRGPRDRQRASLP